MTEKRRANWVCCCGEKRTTRFCPDCGRQLHPVQGHDLCLNSIDVKIGQMVWHVPDASEADFSWELNPEKKRSLVYVNESSEDFFKCYLIPLKQVPFYVIMNNEKDKDGKAPQVLCIKIDRFLKYTGRVSASWHLALQAAAREVHFREAAEHAKKERLDQLALLAAGNPTAHVAALGLDERVLGLLAEMQVERVEQLIERDEDALLGHKGFGPAALRDVSKALSEYQFILAANTREVRR